MSYKKRVARRELPLAPRHRCDEFPCSDEKCPLGHYRTPLEVELTNAVRALVKSKLPPGTTARIGDTPFWEVRVTCGGAIPIMAYTCCLSAGHAGQCYCDYKSVNFTPESTTHSCTTCGSTGFEPSVLPNQCTFCDGTEGGHPPESN